MRNFSWIMITFLVIFITISCVKQDKAAADILVESTRENVSDPSIIAELNCPDGYDRVIIDKIKYPFVEYVRNLPLKPSGSPVRGYDSSIIHDSDEIAFVIDWPLPSKSQQCADVAIRIHAEYLRKSGKVGKIEYKSLSGESIRYSKWLKGRYSFNNSTNQIVYSASSNNKQDTGDEFNRYLEFVMMYANSSSLARDLPKVTEKDLIPGDVYIQPDHTGRGGIGHVSVVLDICKNEDGHILYLFGYGFIPAQDFHLPLPDDDTGIDTWFTLEGYKKHVAGFGEGNFSSGVRHQFLIKF